MELMRASLVLLISASLLSCGPREPDFSEAQTILSAASERIPLCDYSRVFVFDEYSCGVCFDGLILNAQASSEDFLVIYASPKWEKYKYEESQLVGYIDKSKIYPLDYSIIKKLRDETETHKGSYAIDLKDCQIQRVQNF